MAAPGEITRQLEMAQHGDNNAMNAVLDSTYKELRWLAHSYMATERRDHTLQPTALLNEACLRLLGRGAQTWADRQHFFASVALQMRRVLVDHARNRHAQKRHVERGAPLSGSLFDVADPSALSPIDMIAINEALDSLRAVDKRQAHIVELRFFAGLSTVEIAEILDIAERTVRRDWRHARATLRELMGRGDAPDALAS